jgi:hypothetical protein
VNFCLIPEVPFTLEDFLKALAERLAKRGHAVVVAAEGAGQDITAKTGARDASGNIRFHDIGIFLRDRIQAYFKQTGTEISLKYIDPSYTIRSAPRMPTIRLSAFSWTKRLHRRHGRADRHGGRLWVNEFTHVPIPMAVSAKNVDRRGGVWNSVLTANVQPKTSERSRKTRGIIWLCRRIKPKSWYYRTGWKRKIIFWNTKQIEQFMVVAIIALLNIASIQLVLLLCGRSSGGALRGDGLGLFVKVERP